MADSALSEREEAARYLRQKLVDFQRQIAALQHALREQEESHRAAEKGFLLELLELADAFAAFDAAEQRKAPVADPGRQKLGRQVRAMQKKLDFILKGRQVVPMELDGDRARMELCEVVSTEVHPALGDETIVSVLSRGYLQGKDGKVLRKAKVVTVLNHPGGSKP